MKQALKSTSEKSNPKAAWLQWAAMLSMILYFDIMWCYDTTFTSMGMPLTWVNAMLLSLLLSIPALLFHARTVQLVLLAAVGIWLECNLMYCRTYFSHIPLGSYALAGNLADFGSSVVDSMRWRDLGFLGIFIAAMLIPRALNGKEWRKRYIPNPTTVWGYLAWIGFLTLASVTLFWQKGGYITHWQNMYTANFFTTRVPQYTLVGALAYDYINTAPTLTYERKQAVEKWQAAQKPLTALPDSLGHRNNLVFILCESLESWPIGLTLEGKEITPNLNRIVADSSTLYAPNVLTQVGAGRSIDAQLLYNAGMLPLENDVYSFACPERNYHTINQAMRQLRDARSYILTPDKPVVWNQQLVAQSFGIDTLVARECWRKEEMIGVRKKIGDRPLMRQIVEKMESGEVWPRGENAFVQVVTYSGHNPFPIPEEYDDLKLQGDYPELLNNYVTCAHYTDEAIGILMNYLKTRPEWPETLVVIVGDHEGLAAYRPEFAKNYDWVAKRPFTPLIIANSPVAGENDKVIGQVDVYPTLLQLMGLTDYSWHGIGQSILQRDYTSPDQDSLMQVRSRASDTIIRFNLF